MRRNLRVGNIEIMGRDILGFLTLNQALDEAKRLGDGDYQLELRRLIIFWIFMICEF